MSESAKTAFANHVDYRALVDSLSDSFVWNEVTPFDAQHLSEAFGVKRVQLPFLAGFQMLGFAAIQ